MSRATEAVQWRRGWSPIVRPLLSAAWRGALVPTAIYTLIVLLVWFDAVSKGIGWPFALGALTMTLVACLFSLVHSYDEIQLCYPALYSATAAWAMWRQAQVRAST
jgi:hypothetical protein